MATLKLRIDGMTGRRCEDRIERALQEVPGVLGAVANHQADCTEIDYEDDEVELSHLLAVVESLGYHASIAG